MQQLGDGGERKRPGFRYADIYESVRSRGVGAYGGQEARMETASSSHRDEHDDQSEPHEPKVAQLNLKSTLMGLHTMNDDEGLVFSRRSSMSSMLSEKEKPPLEQAKAKVDISGASARTPSGLLYPCPNPGSSCLLNAALFTFDSNLEASTSGGGGGGGSDITEHIFKKLVSQSRLANLDNSSVSPVSTLDVPHSPTSSERSFRAATKRMSLRRRSDDAAAALDARPKNELAQYLMSITALTENAIEDDDLEGPSEVAWLEPEDDNSYHTDLPVVEGYTSKKKPTHERWSSNSSSWNLSLVQKPLRTVSTIVRRQHHTIPGRKSSQRAKVEAIMTTSYDVGTIRSRKLGDRSWFGNSGRRSSAFACSGRFQMEVAAEPDLHEPDMEQANNVKNLRRAKVDEEDFPFDHPIASSFVFREADKAQQTDLHKAVVPVIDSENEELLFSDHHHDPDDASLSDSDGSHALSLDRRSQWLSSRCSFDYGSGFLDVGRSGRFSVDLQRGQKLDKAQHPRTPDVRLRIFKTEKSSKRSILSPCLPFLHRSHSRHQHVPMIQQAPAAGASSRRLQPVNSFTARLGPSSESNSKLAAQFHLQ